MEKEPAVSAVSGRNRRKVLAFAMLAIVAVLCLSAACYYALFKTETGANLYIAFCKRMEPKGISVPFSQNSWRKLKTTKEKELRIVMVDSVCRQLGNKSREEVISMLDSPDSTELRRDEEIWYYYVGFDAEDIDWSRDLELTHLAVKFRNKNVVSASKVEGSFTNLPN